MKFDKRKRKTFFIILLISGMSGLIIFNPIIRISNRTEMELSDELNLIKSASSPLKLWNYTWSGTDLDAGYGVDFDSSGNAYVGGFTENYDKGYRDRDVCAVKFNSSGVVWNYTWVGSKDDEGRDAVVDSEGNVYITGATQSFGAVEKDVCLVKFNSSGVEWNITWGGIDIEEGKGIALDTSGNIYVTGDIYSVSNYDRDIFLVKFNPEGIEQWNYSWGGVNYEFGGDVAVDSSGNAFVCGKTQSFGADGYDMCLLNFNSSGLQWNYTWGGGEDDSGYGVAVDSSGNAYVAGITDSIGSGGDDMCLVKFNSLGVEWSHNWGGSGDEAGWDVSLDSSGNIYVAGSTYSFGAGLTDLCLVKFNSHGMVWNYTWGGSGYDMGYGVTVDSSDKAYVTGCTGSFGASNRDLCLLSIYLDGRPNAPVLYDILPTPDYDGIIKLNWSDVPTASTYYVYKDTYKMTSVDGLIPIAAVSDSNYTDTVNINGIYYYVVVAGNSIVNSTISNRDCVVIDIPVQGWKPQIVRPVGDNPLDICVGDANNDGKNEILVSDTWDGAVSILEWDSIISGDWYHTFKVTGNYTSSVAVGDVNNDGDNDIVTSNYNIDTFASTVSILLWNSGSNDWDDPIVNPMGFIPWDLIIGDADNDGDNDIVTSNLGDDNVSILLWNGGGWDPYISLEAGSQPRSVYLGDADNDGDNDIVTANSASDTFSIFLWNASNNYWDDGIEKQVVGGGPMSIAIGDVNNDSQNEIIFVDDINDEILIFLYNGTDWDVIATLNIGYIPRGLFLGDADNDGDNDIVTANSGDNNVSILLWNGTWWNQQVKREVGNNPSSIFIGDTNNDGVNDIVTANSGDDTVSILLLSELLSSGLYMDFKNQSFTDEKFNITFSVHGINDIGVDNAMIQVWWNDVSVSASDIKDLGSGFYQLTLNPITVEPGEPPILLKVKISADGYEDKEFELYLAVDPATLDKGTPGDGNGTPGIPGYDAFILIGVICIISVIFVKKQHKKKS